ncbi:hypothetical protein [Pedobacter jejuensis]|uniref:DUF4377 domain-containing protein n=1 Tax=Pedobacter jejuensis TaxID=1268550 RepID=A0A3N0BNI9_9SPHI|nr:hypothetical protein [Pedobacter jejuensis]RNL50302.1 hypothetical protein D7004_19095 [Pedobacter jejuensis]
MRYLPLLFLIATFFGCSKQSENGKVVELYVDHYAQAGKQMIYTLPEKSPIDTYLEGFNDRELGFTYKVRAQIYKPEVAPQDGPDRWYVFVKVISKEIYTGTVPFEISLKTSSIFATTLAIRIQNQVFYYGDYILRPENDMVKKQLEEVIALRSKLATDSKYAATVLISATVQHDPNNRSNGYLVKSVKIQ